MSVGCAAKVIYERIEQPTEFVKYERHEARLAVDSMAYYDVSRRIFASNTRFGLVIFWLVR